MSDSAEQATKQAQEQVQKKDEVEETKKENQIEGETNVQQKTQNSESENAVEEAQKLMGDMKVDDENGSGEAQENGQADKVEETPKQSQNQQELLDQTKYFVDISRTNVPFGKGVLFPGSIEEVDVTIGLKDQSLADNVSNEPLMLRVIAKCNNTEFDALDEYVFSVRSNDRFEYFEEVRFKIRKRERAQVKVAVKIPPVKENYNLEGVLQIQLESLQPVCLPITAKCQVPQITCIKDLYKPDEGCHMIKVPAKKNQIRMPPIPFKNMSNFNFTLEVEAITNQSFANRPYDIVTQNFVNCQANMQFFVNLQLKENMNYKGVMPIRDTIRKILVLKIKNSSVYFNYPLEVNVFESSIAGGMS